MWESGTETGPPAQVLRTPTPGLASGTGPPCLVSEESGRERIPARGGADTGGFRRFPHADGEGGARAIRSRLRSEPEEPPEELALGPRRASRS